MSFSARRGLNHIVSHKGFSNFLLGLHSSPKVSDNSAIVDHIRLAAAAALQTVEKNSLQEQSSKTWKEALQRINLSHDDLKKLYPLL